MAEYREYISALKQCAKEHENDNIPFANIMTTELCNDTAKLLERLENGIDKSIDEIYRLPTWGGTLDVSPDKVVEILKRDIEECED